MDSAATVPHGYCLVCLGLLPVEQQDSGGLYCSRACEHVATRCGPVKNGDCVVCGALVARDWGRICCSKACSLHLQRISSRFSCRKRGESPHICPTCGAYAGKSKYCSPACQPKNTHSRSIGCTNHDRFDNYTPSEEEYDAIYDGCVSRGVFSLSMEVELLAYEASHLRGIGSSPIKMIMHVEGPQGAVPMHNLGVHRKDS